MPKLSSFVVAEGISIDQLTSRVTAFNMIDHFLLPALPARIVRLSALSMYELDDTADRFLERVRLVAPDGTTSGVSQSFVDLPARPVAGMPNGHRSLHVLWSLPLHEVGDYRMVLEHNTQEPPPEDAWEAIASVCITALVQSHPILNAQTPSVTVPSVAPISGP